MQTLALIANDSKKEELLKWVNTHSQVIDEFYNVIATSSTGDLLQTVLESEIATVNSGAEGGDEEIACMIVQGHIDKMVFLVDFNALQPHQIAINALVRRAVIANIPVAFNTETATKIL